MKSLDNSELRVRDLNTADISSKRLHVVGLRNLMLIIIGAVYGYSKSCATGDHFVGKTPIDTNIVRISRTVSKDQSQSQEYVFFWQIW